MSFFLSFFLSFLSFFLSFVLCLFVFRSVCLVHFFLILFLSCWLSVCLSFFLYSFLPSFLPSFLCLSVFLSFCSVCLYFFLSFFACLLNKSPMRLVKCLLLALQSSRPTRLRGRRAALHGAKLALRLWPKTVESLAQNPVNWAGRRGPQQIYIYIYIVFAWKRWKSKGTQSKKDQKRKRGS